MRFTPRTWSLLSVMLFVAAIFFWLKGNDHRERQRQGVPAKEAAPAKAAAIDLMSTQAAPFTLAALGTPPMPGLPAQVKSAGARRGPDDPLNPHRLRNTQKNARELLNDPRAILMMNAFIDTSTGGIAVPEHLRAGEEPGSYIVQWFKASDRNFRATISRVGGSIVSYVPNNAYLVKANAAQAEVLRAAPGIQAVLPYEPYYKLDKRLLETAIEQRALHPETVLRLTFFPGAGEAGLTEVRGLHAQVLAREDSPFGPQAIVRPPVDTLAELARLPQVQAIEPAAARVPANDYTRVAVGISPDSQTNLNYMDLTGSNIWVNMNDSGVDTNHADLEGRVFPVHPSLTEDDDPEGHGTFVAAIIAGDGSESDSVEETNQVGSATNANFRGMAPEAKIFVLPLDSGQDVYSHVLDSYLYETAARTNYVTLDRTNSLISNNSWTYVGAAEYDSAAARYDAAVRDSMPGMSGEQPVLFIFAAGNGGFGSEDGFGGQPNSIFSPGTAKNVITVGALEAPRFIEVGYTNVIITTNDPGTTNEMVITNEEVIFPYANLTDSATQVASYSSRGNVGIGTEGFFGRFKPDLVAPGTMIVSAKSAGYELTNHIVVTNEPGRTFEELNEPLGEYRIDSGTTYAAPVVSGMLALVQEFFAERAPEPLRREHLSPALMKALMINGARSVTDNYDLQVRTLINYQGWGMPLIHRVIPTNLTSSDELKWSMRLVDQHPTNALSTGESRTWKVTLSTNAAAFPFRATLVWTDPPGNPAVGVKLVNNLDLIVTNLETGVVFYGNNFPGGSDFVDGMDPEDIPDFDPEVFQDSVNNVENVFIREALSFGREFTITVRAKRVNVTAIGDYLARTDQPRDVIDVVQDFALVISSDVTLEDEDVFEEFEPPARTEPPPGHPGLTVITNGLPLLNERAGAQASLVGTNGVTNQWNFYVFTNTFIENSLVSITNGSNVAFVTFNPPNLSEPRQEEADIDLYVSTIPLLTNLHPGVLSGARKSLNRGGTEMVAFTNASIGQVFYIAVNSQDQQGAEFSLMGISTDLPLDQEQNGMRVLRGFPISAFIPDGSPTQPSAATVMAIGLTDKRVQRVIVTNIISHQDLGDLLGVLSHYNSRAVLNNHNLFGLPTFPTNQFVYDDWFAPVTGSRPTDGPGTLGNFAGQRIVGPWMLQMIDNAPGSTGRVELLTLLVEPLRDNLLPGVAVEVAVSSNIVYFPIDVPPGVTNIIFQLDGLNNRPMEALIRRDELPTPFFYDFKATNRIGQDAFEFSFPPPGSDPLSPGTYFLGLYNPIPALRTTVNLLMLFEYGFDPDNQGRHTIPGVDLLDYATTNSIIDITADKVVANVEVAVRLDHPRVSDTALHLVSPQGTRLLLAENRGWTTTRGFGLSQVVTNNSTNLLTNIAYTVFTEDTNLAAAPIKFALAPFNAMPANAGIIFTNGFEGVGTANYSRGASVAGWDVPSSALQGSSVSIITGTNYSHTGTNILSLGNASVERDIVLEPGKSYSITFAYRGAEEMNFFSTGMDNMGDPLPAGGVDENYLLIESANTNFPGPAAYVIDPRNSTRVFSHWASNTALSQWIAPYPYYTNAPLGTNIYRYRTYFSMYDRDPLTVVPAFRWAADDHIFSRRVQLNGTDLTRPALNPPLIDTIPISYPITPAAGLNVLDFFVSDLGLVTGLRVQVLRGLPARSTETPSFSVVFNGQTNVLTGPSGWTTRTIHFVARSRLETLEFRSGAGEVWIDSVAIEGTGNIFVLPEESLELFEGERAYGEWRLEVRDARTGAAVPDPELIEWKLNLGYADPLIFAETLRSGVTYPTRVTQRQRRGIIPGRLATNQVQYFLVETCPDTTELRVTLTGITNIGQLELWADLTGFPTFDPERDDYVRLRNEDDQNGNGVAEFFIDLDSPASAPLRPGEPVFFAVRNKFRNQTNSYTLRAVFDNSSCQGARASTAALASGESVTSTLPAGEEGMENAGELFEMAVPLSASNLEVALEANGGAALLAQRGEPPTADSYAYRQELDGSGRAELRITAESEVSLPGARWYFLVLNQDDEAILYSLSASLEEEERPVITPILQGGGLTLSWNSAPGALYEIQVSTDLQNWSELTQVRAEGALETYSVPLVYNAEERFFRIARIEE